jgi:hypothetical protein
MRSQASPPQLDFAETELGQLQSRSPGRDAPVRRRSPEEIGSGEPVQPGRRREAIVAVVRVVVNLAGNGAKEPERPPRAQSGSESVRETDREIPSYDDAKIAQDPRPQERAEQSRGLFSSLRIGEAGRPGDPDAVPPAPRNRRRAPVDRDVFVEERPQNPGTSLAMISFMISLVPPPMVRSRASRKARAIGVSTTYPIPP